MGLFDAFSKIAKDVVKDVAKDVLSDVVGGGQKSSQSVVYNEPEREEVQETNECQEPNEVQENQDRPEITTIDFQPVHSPEDAKEYFSQNNFDDENGTGKVLVQSYRVRNEYHRTRVYDGELTDVLVYYPDGSDDEYVEFDNLSIPYVFIGFDQATYNVVKSYLDNGTVKQGTSIEKVTNSIADYRTRVTIDQGEGESCFLCYNFYTYCEHSVYTQMGVSYPAEYMYTDREQEYIQLLDEVMSSYNERIADEWDMTL